MPKIKLLDILVLDLFGHSYSKNIKIEIDRTYRIAARKKKKEIKVNFFIGLIYMPVAYSRQSCQQCRATQHAKPENHFEPTFWRLNEQDLTPAKHELK